MPRFVISRSQTGRAAHGTSSTNRGRVMTSSTARTRNSIADLQPLEEFVYNLDCGMRFCLAWKVTKCRKSHSTTGADELFLVGLPTSWVGGRSKWPNQLGTRHQLQDRTKLAFAEHRLGGCRVQPALVRIKVFSLFLCPRAVKVLLDAQP